MNTAFGGDVKAALAVEVDITLHTDSSYSHFGGFFKGIIEQNFAVALSLKIRMNTYRSKGHYRQNPSVIRFNFGAYKHNMPYNLPAELQAKVKLLNKLGSFTEPMQYIMLRTARAVDIPERLAGKILYLTVVLGYFSSDSVFFFHFNYLS